MTTKSRPARYVLQMVLKSTGEIRESRSYAHKAAYAHYKEVKDSPLFSSVKIVKLGAAR